MFHELRQLVHRRRPKQPADPRDPWIVLGRLHRSGPRLGVRHHRSELQRAEHPPAQADPILPEQHRPAILELDRERHQRPRAAPTR